MRKRFVALFASIGLAVGLATVVAQSPALAVDVNNYCYIGTPNGDLCYWYHPSFTGAKAGLWQANPDLLNPRVVFPGPGDGAGNQIGNDAASAADYDTAFCGHIWYYAGYSGPVVTLQSYTHSGWYTANLGTLRNENRSQNWSYCP